MNTLSIRHRAIC